MCVMMKLVNSPQQTISDSNIHSHTYYTLTGLKLRGLMWGIPRGGNGGRPPWKAAGSGSIPPGGRKTAARPGGRGGRPGDK